MGIYLCRSYCTVSRHSKLPNVKIPAHNARTRAELHSEGRFNRIMADRQSYKRHFYSVIQISGAHHVQWRAN